MSPNTSTHAAPATTRAPDATALLSLIASVIGSQIEKSRVTLGDAEITVSRTAVIPFFTLLKTDTTLQFNLLLSVTAIDWVDERNERFEVVYHLRSLVHGLFLRVRVPVPETDPTIPSIVPLWASADFMERECWDMYGVVFAGHPNLTRILMYDEFKGHPLRKDYPLQGKQPRIPLRSPEVRNTAVDMVRPTLVQINRGRSSQNSEASPAKLIERKSLASEGERVRS